MRNFQTWLIANGLKLRMFASKAQVKWAWEAYVKWLCGGNDEVAQQILEETAEIVAATTEDNALGKLQELEVFSWKSMKDRPTLKPVEAIDTVGRKLDQQRDQKRASLPNRVALKHFAQPLPFNPFSVTRIHPADFSKLCALVSPEGIERVMAIKSGKAQYSSPGIGTPSDPIECLNLCNMILSHRVGVIARAQPVFTCAQVNWTGKAPIYVVSSNRSGWLRKSLKKGTFYGPLIGQRPIIFVVGDGERETYGEILKMKGQGTANGVYVLSCAGGFGMGWNRHCALLHAKANGQAKVWMLDDNVLMIKQSGSPVVDLSDDWIGESLVTPLYPGIMQQALGFNVTRLKEINFCPLFACSKEDLSLETILTYVYNPPGYVTPECSVIKVDKTTIEADFAMGPPGRADFMMAVAGLKMWKLAGGKTVDLLLMGVSPYLVMKFQEQVLYDCLQVMRADERTLRMLAQLWFVDMDVWTELP